MIARHIIAVLSPSNYSWYCVHVRTLLSVVSAWLSPLDLGLLCLLSHCCCVHSRLTAGTQVKCFMIWVFLPSMCLGAAVSWAQVAGREKGATQPTPLLQIASVFNSEQKLNPACGTKLSGKEPWGFLSGQGSIISIYHYSNKLNRWWTTASSVHHRGLAFYILGLNVPFSVTCKKLEAATLQI